MLWKENPGVCCSCGYVGKYLAANVKKGYSQVGNELLHEVGSSCVVKVAQKDTPVSLSNFFALLLILNQLVRFNLLTPEEQYKPDLTITS